MHAMIEGSDHSALKKTLVEFFFLLTILTRPSVASGGSSTSATTKRSARRWWTRKHQRRHRQSQSQTWSWRTMSLWSALQRLNCKRRVRLCARDVHSTICSTCQAVLRNFLFSCLKSRFPDTQRHSHHSRQNRIGETNSHNPHLASPCSELAPCLSVTIPEDRS